MYLKIDNWVIYDTSVWKNQYAEHICHIVFMSMWMFCFQLGGASSPSINPTMILKYLFRHCTAILYSLDWGCNETLPYYAHAYGVADQGPPYPQGTRVTYTCYQGYKLRTDETGDAFSIECLPGFNWSVSSDACQMSECTVEIYRRFKWEFWCNTQLPRARPANFHPCPTLLIVEGPCLKPVRKNTLHRQCRCLQRHYSFQPNPGPTVFFTMKPLPSLVAPVLITWAVIIRFQVRRI